MKKALFISGMISCVVGVFYLVQWAICFMFAFAYVFAGRSSGDDYRWWINLHRDHHWMFLLGSIVITIGVIWAYKNRKKFSDFFDSFFNETND